MSSTVSMSIKVCQFNSIQVCQLNTLVWLSWRKQINKVCTGFRYVSWHAFILIENMANALSLSSLIVLLKNKHNSRRIAIQGRFGRVTAKKASSKCANGKNIGAFPNGALFPLNWFSMLLFFCTVCPFAHATERKDCFYNLQYGILSKGLFSRYHRTFREF